MGHVRQMGHVDVSPDRAFALTIDPTREPEWNNSIVEVKDVSGKLDTVGASYVAIMKLGGRRLETRWEVSKVEKAKSLEQTATSDQGGHATATTTFEPAAGGTDITIEVDYELPGGFVGGMADKLFVERAIERDIKHSIENFKAIIEVEEQVPA
jgi:Polyketide cyclase / dehydrase and lipid transport